MPHQAEIDADRLAQLPTLHLSSGSHKSIEEGACAMETVSWIAREPWSDHPQCTCPVIGSFVRSWNDALPDADRDEFLLPLIPRLVGTRGSSALEMRRSLMAADWLVRTHTPAWLRLAGLIAQADTLSSLPEITSMAQMSSIHPAIDAVRRDAAAVWDAAWDAARDAVGTVAVAVAVAGTAAWEAARDAVGTVAGDAARTAVGTVAGDAARDAARDVVWDAAWDAARDAVGTVALAVATEKLRPTKIALQQSALALLSRMIEASDPQPELV